MYSTTERINCLIKLLLARPASREEIHAAIPRYDGQLASRRRMLERDLSYIQKHGYELIRIKDAHKIIYSLKRADSGYEGEKEKEKEKGWGGARPGSGPKPKSPEDKLGRGYYIQLLGSTKAEIKQIALRQGVSPESVIRDLVMAGLKNHEK